MPPGRARCVTRGRPLCTDQTLRTRLRAAPTSRSRWCARTALEALRNIRCPPHAPVAQTVEAAVSSYRELFERQLGRARARLQEEREARERSAVEATQAKAKLQACEAELQSAMATIAALRAQGQPSEGLPPPRDGGPPGQVRARLPRFACLSFVALVFNLTACRRSCCRGRSPRGARQRSLLRPVCATSEPNAQFATGCSQTRSCL